MSEKELNEIFARRLKYYMDKYDMSQTELAKRIGVGTSTISHWCRAERTPRSDALEKLCEVFNCKSDDLITEKTEQQYYDEETAAIAQDIKDNTDLRLLLSSAKGVSHETIQDVHKYLLYLKNKELHLDD